MKPIALGLGLLITVAAGGAMLLSSGGSTSSSDSSFQDRAERVMGSRGRRRPQEGIANRSSGRTMFRSVQAWGARDRSRFAADAPSRLSARDRLRAGNDASSVIPNPRQSIRPTQRDTGATPNARPAPGVRPGRGADARRQSMQERVRQRELDAQQRRLQMQEERLRRLNDARQRSARMAVSNRGGGLISALNSLAAGDSPGSLGGDGDGEGGTRDPNAPPSMDEIMGLFEAFGIDPSSGMTTTTGGSFGSSSTGNTGSRTGSGFNNTGSSGGSGGGSGPTITTGDGGGGVVDGSVSLVWQPVDHDECAIEFTGFRTNDLFVRIEVTSSIGELNLNSVPVLSVTFEGLKIENGEYFNDDGVYTLPVPNPFETNPDPCLAFDTFVALGDTRLVPLPSIEFQDPLRTQIDLTLFQFSGVPAVRNRLILNDDAFYLRIARITAPTTITDMTGQINVGFLLGGGIGSFSEDTAIVEFRSDLWGVNTGPNSSADFALVSPLDTQHLTDTAPTLDWNAVGNDETIFIVRIAEDTDDDGFPDVAVLEETISPAVSPAEPAPAATTFAVPLGTLNYKLNYTWFIEAQFSDGSSIFSDTRVFRTPVCLGDANYDKEVDFNDITAVFSNLGMEYPPNLSGPGDADNSGFVDSHDTATVLFYFGNPPCP